MPIEDRYFAFVDILGFSDFVYSLDCQDRRIEDLFRRYEETRKTLQGWHDTFRFSYFSDSILVSIPAAEEDSLGSIIFYLQLTSIATLAQGFLVRGALVRGPTCHERSQVYGRAIIDAYEAEKSVAHFPRIILSKEVRQNLSGVGDYHVNTFASSDGPISIDLLATFNEVAKKNAEEKAWLAFAAAEPGRAALEDICSIREHLHRMIVEHRDHPRRYSKIRWFCEYFNEFLKKGRPGHAGWPPLVDVNTAF